MDVVAGLAGGISTEIERTRRRIDGAALRLLATLPEDDSARDDAEEIRRAADALASLASELQSAARRRPRDAGPIDVNDVITSSLPLLRVICGERVVTRVALDRSAARVEADPRHITQILLNLTANACSAMLGDGRLVLRTADADLIWSGPGSAPLPPGRYVVIEMRDTRDTPDAAALDTLFEPFVASESLNGLRLAVAHALVTQNSGFLTADPAPEGGLVFRVYLPRLPSPPSDGPIARQDPASP
jgi:signal transduction histidine kinase